MIDAVLPKDNDNQTTTDHKAEALTTRYRDIEGQGQKAGQGCICYIEEKGQSIG